MLPRSRPRPSAVDARYRESSAALGRYTAELIPDGARILTHCWADQFLIGAVTAAQQTGKSLEFVCTETRPYLQGARLTAATLVEMGYTPTLITDGMVATVLASGGADVLLTAADRVTLDGHVVNKVGTLGAALAASHFGVPYYAMVDHPDPHAPTIGDVRHRRARRRRGARVRRAAHHRRRRGRSLSGIRRHPAGVGEQDRHRPRCVRAGRGRELLRVTARAVVVDIEGTTSSTASVHVDLYDYARPRLGPWIEAHADDDEVAAAVAATKADAGLAPGATTTDVVAALHSWMDADSRPPR